MMKHLSSDKQKLKLGGVYQLMSKHSLFLLFTASDLKCLSSKQQRNSTKLLFISATWFVLVHSWLMTAAAPHPHSSEFSPQNEPS